MKIFGFSLFTIFIIALAYFVGAKYPGAANKITSTVKSAV